MRRRSLLLCLGVLSLAASVPARADLPVLGGPVLRSDTQWIQTDWGYKKAALSLSPTPPAGYPADYRWPTLMETEGYGGAGTPNAYLRMDDGELMALNISFGRGPRKDYAYVKASVRGTECSGGHYNLYDRRHAWDGYHIIEWIADQDWSNEHVGLHGSSLSGQTAYWIATTQPPHLSAVSANALHSDIYRDIFMVGGVQNNLFPIIWTYGTGPHRLPSEAFDNGTFQDDEICQWNVAVSKFSHLDAPQPENEPAWAGVRAVDDDWYASHAAVTYAPSIKIPYYQQVNWQDEQVGPRAMVLFNHIRPTPRQVTDANGDVRTIEPKTFTMSSGDHGWGRFHDRDLYDFLDIWTLGRADVDGLYDHKVRNYFETRNDDWAHGFTAMKYGDTWPFEGTRYPKLYLHEEGAANFDAPTGTEQSETYVSVAPRFNWFWEEDQAIESPVTSARGYPDQVSYASAPVEPGQDLVVSGPLLMDLWASVAGTDTDFYVTVSDVYPDGNVSFIQKGLLKASHRRVDARRSYYDGSTLVQPYHSHTNPQPLSPGEATEFQLEIFPIGHIFRPGHQILIQIMTPPALDGLWGYTPTHHQASAVTILHDADHPSWVQLPVVDLPEDQPSDALMVAPPGCKVPGGFPCFPKSSLDR